MNYETRWVERHDVAVVFVELFPAVITTLEDISDTASGESAVSARNLMLALHNMEFAVGTIVIEIST